MLKSPSAQANPHQKGSHKSTREARMYDLPMMLILGYLMVEYVRPPYISAFRPALLIQAFFLVYMFKRRDTVAVVVRDTYIKLFIALMALMTIHIFTAYNNYWAFAQWQVMIMYLIFGIAFCMFIDTPERLKVAVNAFVFFHAVCALNRLLGAPLHVGVTGPMGDTNDFALAMNVVLPISFFVGLHHSLKKRLVYWGCCFFFIAANVMCESRGGFVGLCAVALITVGFSRYKVKAFAALLIVFIVFWSLAPESFKNEMASIEEEGADTGTGQERVELWKVAWRGYLANPVIGVGQGNISFRLADYQYDKSGKSFFHRELWARSVHSVYFTALPELGTVGFGIWIWMLVNIYTKYRKMDRDGSEDDKENIDPVSREHLIYIRKVGFGLLIGTFGYLASGIFLSAFYYPNLWSVATMMAACNLIRNRMELQTAESQNQSDS